MGKDKGKNACCGCKCCGSACCLIAVILLIIGGLNWGVIGLFNVDVVKLVFGSVPLLVQIVYVLFGLAALCKIYVIALKKR